VLQPRLGFQLPDTLEGRGRDAVRERLERWLGGWVSNATGPLGKLGRAALAGAGRGLAYLLEEGLGNVPTRDARLLLGSLGEQDRAQLTRLGVRFGVRHLYLPAMLKGSAIDVRARLWALHHRSGGLALPPVGRVAFRPGGDVPEAYLAAVGYERLGGHAVRIDMVERLGARLRALARNSPFELPTDLMALVGLTADDLAALVTALGYVDDGAGRYLRSNPNARRASIRRKAVRPSASSPFAALATLRRSG
jgi:ATP-dependent RNA helicase SUPV3L1/SUV3